MKLKESAQSFKRETVPALAINNAISSQIASSGPISVTLCVSTSLLHSLSETHCKSSGFFEFDPHGDVSLNNDERLQDAMTNYTRNKFRFFLFEEDIKKYLRPVSTFRNCYGLLTFGTCGLLTCGTDLLSKVSRRVLYVTIHDE